jgi:hypothetical protein
MVSIYGIGGSGLTVIYQWILEELHTANYLPSLYFKPETLNPKLFPELPEREEKIASMWCMPR